MDPNTLSFYFEKASTDTVRREKEKAGALRKTQWWLRQLAKGQCYYCCKNFPPIELTMDHIVPLIRGGRSTRGNVVPACKDCNNKKKYLLPVEWSDYLQSLSADFCAGEPLSSGKSEDHHNE